MKKKKKICVAATMFKKPIEINDKLYFNNVMYFNNA